MKKYLLPSILLFAASAFAQTTPNTMYLNLKNGNQVEYTISDIENITFGVKGSIDPVVSTVSFAVPSTFSSSYVLKVMAGGKQVAEIDKEYIKSINKQVVVVYPCDENGKAILTKGITANGASVVWNESSNTATVGEEGDPIEKFYISEGELLTSFDGNADAATITPDQISDIRGTESNIYNIVKIGTQYWMAENLRATRYLDGSSIDAYTETESDSWKTNTTGAYLAYGEKEWVAMVGYLYSGYAVINEKGIAPEGWAVPTQAELTKLKSAGNTVMVNFKSDADLTWAVDGTGNNITGFDAIATGYYSTATGLNGLNTEAWFWSSTKYYDSYYKCDDLDYMRITATGKNVTISSSMLGGHSLPFGHSIRCIRK